MLMLICKTYYFATILFTVKIMSTTAESFLQCTFLGLGTFLLLCCIWRVRKLQYFIKNILILVLKMNEGLRGLEQHEGD